MVGNISISIISKLTRRHVGHGYDIFVEHGYGLAMTLYTFLNYRSTPSYTSAYPKNNGNPETFILNSVLCTEQKNNTFWCLENNKIHHHLSGWLEWEDFHTDRLKHLQHCTLQILVSGHLRRLVTVEHRTNLWHLQHLLANMNLNTWFPRTTPTNQWNFSASNG